MTVNVIATGSSGNLYEILDSKGNSILIEAGIPRHKYMEHKISKNIPEMCLISHGHMDHSKFWGEYAAFMPAHKWQERNDSENWRAQGFKLKHGDGQSTAFIIKSHVDNDLIFFGTDFEFSKDYTELYDSLIRLKVNKFLIECNYNDYLFHLADDIQREGCSRHMSDNDVIHFMKIVNPKNPKIILIHGSNRLSADTYTKKTISSKLITATVAVAVGAKGKTKNIFNI